MRAALTPTRILLGLSGVTTGLDLIKSGRIEEGTRVAEHGVEYLRSMLGEEAVPGKTATDQACAKVAAYMRQRRAGSQI